MTGTVTLKKREIAGFPNEKAADWSNPTETILCAEHFPRGYRIVSIIKPLAVCIEQVPDGLKSLSISDAENLIALSRFPNSLRSFNLFRNARLKHIPPLPREVFRLQVDNCAQLELQAFPEGLRQLCLFRLPWKRLPCFPEKLEVVTFERCEQLKLTACQIEQIDEMRYAEQAGDSRFYVKGYDEIRQNSLPSTLREAGQFVFEAAKQSLPHVADPTDLLERGLASQGNAISIDRFVELVGRMLTEDSAPRGGVTWISRDMIGTLTSLARHPNLWPHVLDLAGHVPPNTCVNQPVLAWRNIAALVAVHERASQARCLGDVLDAARPLLALIALDEAVSHVLGEHRRRIAQREGRPNDALSQLEPEIANSMLLLLNGARLQEGQAPLPGAPRQVVYADIVQDFVHQHYWTCAQTVQRVLDKTDPSCGARYLDAAFALSHGPFADWWETQLVRWNPSASRELGPDGRIKKDFARWMEVLDDRMETMASGEYEQWGREIQERRDWAIREAREMFTRETLAAPSPRMVWPNDRRSYQNLTFHDELNGARAVMPQRPSSQPSMGESGTLPRQETDMRGAARQRNYARLGGAHPRPDDRLQHPVR